MGVVDWIGCVSETRKKKWRKKGRKGMILFSYAVRYFVLKSVENRQLQAPRAQFQLRIPLESLKRPAAYIQYQLRSSHIEIHRVPCHARDTKS